MLVLNALSMAVGFLLFRSVADQYVGARLTDTLGLIAAQYFPIGGIITLVLTGVGALWMIGVAARRVTGPLARLKRAAAEIRDGNLGYELAVSGHDEFTELSAGFERMRVRLKDSMRLQERAEMERRAMMASVTHDLKTPITSIIGYAEGVLDGVADTPEKVREYMTVICKKARSLQALSDDLSLLSRLENAQLPLNKQEEDLSELVAEVASEFSHNEPAMKLEQHITPGLRTVIDRERMARVLLNIFQNSSKYKKPEQPGAEIVLTLVKRGNEALLTVSDKGMGIAQSDIPHLFDQFYRADASRGVQSGSGLGLSIARQLIQLHRGKIWITGNRGGGISVNISLPLIGGTYAKNTHC
jgi:signal transduction histidine kinase